VLDERLPPPAARTTKDGQRNYIWREGLAAGQPPTLLGRPVEFDETMPNVGPDATPVVFGDFRRRFPCPHCA